MIVYFGRTVRKRMKWMTKINGPGMEFLNRVTDLMGLNLCFLLCCIPVVTVGASLSAMYAVVLRKKRDTGVVRTFFSAFRESFRKATACWLILLAAGILLLADFHLLGMTGGSYAVIYYGLYLWGFILLAVGGYAFPLISRFENTVVQTLKNAFLIAFSMLPKTMLILAVNAAPVILLLVDPDLFGRSLILWLLLGFSGTAKINCRIIGPIFHKLSEKEEDAEPG